MDVKSVYGSTAAALTVQSPPRPSQQEVQQEQLASASASAGTAKTEAEQPSAVDSVNIAVERPGGDRVGTRLRVDSETSTIIAQIVGENNEVIKQIPPEEQLRIMDRIRQMQGMLFDERA